MEETRMVGLGMIFQPEEIKLMRSALDEAAIILPKAERTSAMKVKLASRILAAAAKGERDPNKLRIAALLKEITARADEQNAETQFVGYLHALFDHRPPDLIVTFGALGGAFVQRHRSELFPAIPMILTTIEARRVQSLTLTENDTVVAVDSEDRLEKVDAWIAAHASEINRFEAIRRLVDLGLKKK
jgi:hypothetical protein